MDKKNLGTMLGLVLFGIGVTGFLSVGFVATVMPVVLYYTITGFILTEFTDYSDNMFTWLPEMLGFKISK